MTSRLPPYIKHKLKPGSTSTGKTRPGVTPRTVNIALEKAIRILRLYAWKWRDEEKRPWLGMVPMISKLDEKRSRHSACQSSPSLPAAGAASAREVHPAKPWDADLLRRPDGTRQYGHGGGAAGRQ